MIHQSSISANVSTDPALDAANVRVFDLVLPSASTHTYSANILSVGYANDAYLSTTAGSSAALPVALESNSDIFNEDDDLLLTINDGLKHDATLIVDRIAVAPVDIFILLFYNYIPLTIYLYFFTKKCEKL